MLIQFNKAGVVSVGSFVIAESVLTSTVVSEDTTVQKDLETGEAKTGCVVN